MSSSSIPTAVDGFTVVNANLLNAYRDAIAQIESGSSPVPRVAILVNQPGHAFSVGNWLRRPSGSPFTKAQANSDGNARGVCGVVSRVLSGDAFELTVQGYVSGLSGLTTGPNFLAVSVLGGVQSSKPSPGNPIVSCIVADSDSSGYVCVGGLDPNPSPVLPSVAMGDLLAGNNSSAWGAVSSSGSANGNVLTKDDTATPFGLKWAAPASPLPGGGSKGSLLVHDATTNWGTVTPATNNHILVADDAQGFGVKFAGIAGLATADQKAAYALLSSDADRVAYIAAYLGLV